MKKGLYIYQDLVSHGTSEVITVNTDNELRRFIAVYAARCPVDQEYVLKDSHIYHIGNLYVDDETGAIAIEPLPMRLVCRGSDFTIGSARSVNIDEQLHKDDVELPAQSDLEYAF